MFDKTASAIGMVTREKLRRGFAYEIRDNVYFVLWCLVYFLSFVPLRKTGKTMNEFVYCTNL